MWNCLVILWENNDVLKSILRAFFKNILRSRISTWSNMREDSREKCSPSSMRQIEERCLMKSFWGSVNRKGKRLRINSTTFVQNCHHCCRNFSWWVTVWGVGMSSVKRHPPPPAHVWISLLTVCFACPPQANKLPNAVLPIILLYSRRAQIWSQEEYHDRLLGTDRQTTGNTMVGLWGEFRP